MLTVDYLPVTLDAVVGSVSSRAAQRATKTAIFTFASFRCRPSSNIAQIRQQSFCKS